MEDFTMYNEANPVFRDPRFQRRVLEMTRTVDFVENMHEAKLECGHVPLLLGEPVPAVGDMLFCPTCYEEGKNA